MFTAIAIRLEGARTLCGPLLRPTSRYSQAEERAPPFELSSNPLALNHANLVPRRESLTLRLTFSLVARSGRSSKSLQ